MVHGSRRGHRAGVKGLHLVGAETVFLQPHRQMHHVFIARAGVGCDEVRNQILLLASLSAVLVKHLFEAVVAADAWLHHHRQRTAFGVLGRDLQIATDMVRHQLFHILGAFDREVVAQARTNEDFFHATQGARFAVELNQRRVAGVQVLANAGEHAARFTARGFDLWCFAADAVHISGGAAEVADHTGEAWNFVAYVFNLTKYRFFTAALNNAAFVLGDRTKRATAKTAAHDVDAEANHLPRRNFCFAIVTALRVRIHRVRAACIRQVKHMVHLGGGQRNRRRVDPHIARGAPLAMRLHQGTRITGVGFQMQNAIGMRIQHRVGFDLLVRRQTDHRAFARRHFQFTFALQCGVGHELQRGCGEAGFALLF